MKYEVPSINTTISHTKDGGLRIGFMTNELTKEEKMVIIQSFRSFGQLTFEVKDNVQDQ